ncbi:MAG: DUF4105 domain-containing protein [Gemmatimonadetes bacterium]|nr:DUF4105 domain-containing protein [Gemmatimonadota bacterium]
MIRCSVASARENSPPPWLDGTSAAADIQVYLVTFGDGSDVASYFGHNSVVVEDTRLGAKRLYNYGMFDFGPDMLPKFLMGRLWFWVGEASAPQTFAFYRSFDRTVEVQTLYLPPEKRLELARIFANDVLPENRDYRYDHYYDNCSTRIRDAIDSVVGGQFKLANATPARLTLRGHTRRLTRKNPPLELLLIYWMNDEIDKDTTQWEEMFLPLRLKEHLEGVRIVNSEGDPGPLLGEAVQLVEAVGRDPVPPAAPDLRFPLLLLGLVLGAFFAGLGWVAGDGKRWGRWALALSGATWSASVGFFGTALFLSWFFTDHIFWTLNENVFQANPVSLVLAALLAVMLVREVLNGNEGPGGGRAGIWAGIHVDVVAKVVGGLAIAGLFVQVFPGFDQVNGEVMAVLLPAHVGLAWGVLRAWPPSMV